MRKISSVPAAAQSEKLPEIRIPLLLFFTGLLISCILMSLPLYRFQAAVYTKKSSNTFVGDEKYVEVLAEVEEEAQRFRDQGMDVKIQETVTERVNSKGETTSLITFTINQEYEKNVWSFLTSKLASSLIAKIMAACMLLSVLCLAAGCAGSLQIPLRKLSAGKKTLRSLSALFLLADLILVPVFILCNNVIFWRRLRLFQDGQLENGREAFFAALDDFLFDGKMGSQIESALKSLSAHHSALLWVLALCFFLAMLGAVQLRFGTVKNTLLRGLLYAFIAVVCVITLYPYYVMLVTAFRSNAETLDMYFLHLLPTRWLWSNLKDIVSRGVPGFLLNSFIIAGGATLLAMLCGIPAAFAMARMNFRGKKFFLGFVIVSQMFSPVVLLIGIAQLMNTLHLNDTLWGLVFINAAFNQAFAVWLLRGTFVAISPEMEQAAKIDGCSTMQSLIRILLPMPAPGIVTTLIFVFINAWNEYTISTVLISTAQNRPITVGITQFSSFNMIEWQYLFAASLLATIPVVILFMMIEKHLTSGLTSGGVKG